MHAYNTFGLHFFLWQANARYSSQLSLQQNVKCVYEEDGGILLASKAMAAYQVKSLLLPCTLVVNHKHLVSAAQVVEYYRLTKLELIINS